MAERLRWLPNTLTLFRVAALPLIAGLIAVSDGPTAPLAAAVFAVAAVTDLADGWLARRLGAESDFGRLADPFADRLLAVIGLMGLISLGRLPWLLPVAILARDGLMLAGSAWLEKKGRWQGVDRIGKFSSALVAAAIGFALLTQAMWADWLFVAAVVVSLGTLAHYALRERYA